jgi:hypothetical protein
MNNNMNMSEPVENPIKSEEPVDPAEEPRASGDEEVSSKGGVAVSETPEQPVEGKKKAFDERE